MYVVVAGGGKVGFYLAKALIAEGHEVLVIEREARKAEIINEELGSVVLRGDACEASTLSEAGVNRADVVVAVTGHDEDNLVICQMAKKKFNVPRTIARINNPKNEQIFRLLGIDSTVSSTDLIMQQIEQELHAQALVHLRLLRDADLELIQAPVAPQSAVVGKKLREIRFPKETLILAVVHDGTTSVGSADTRLEAGDLVIALTRASREPELRALLLA
ncbi:MAG: TrkA family potassium uptake protein [Chloroflexi bacterium]|jgi:trk system potassium uptake protein TrkA|nr:TrkA family potassium uptake protein [Chloroflexota bacterium]HLG50303.1 TrkA family potassium uptake protein [Chloroflexota bacterium]